jgi:chemotaxis signal transduction protein
MVMSKINNLLEEIKDIIVFEISDIDYCTFIKDITAIINPLTKYPNVLFNSDLSSVQFEGNFLTIFNLSKILDEKCVEINSHSRILIIEMGGQKYGFLVNRIKEIISLDKNYSSINLHFDKNNTDNSKFCSGIIEFEGSKYKMLDCPKLIDRYIEKISIIY